MSTEEQKTGALSGAEPGASAQANGHQPVITEPGFDQPAEAAGNGQGLSARQQSSSDTAAAAPGKADTGITAPEPPAKPPIPIAMRGGGFLLEGLRPEEVFTPEDFTEEHRMIADLAESFVQESVLPHDEQIEAGQDWELTVRLLREAGELGLLGAEVPEAYGGSDLDKAGATLITEKLVRASSFALSHGAHVGIGSLPIVLFGTPEQQRRYLPDLASGRRLAAYCLTEPSSGSDALGARTTAVLSGDGQHYILNGSKQYITNAAFADLFIVYAKVDGRQFTAFIVERGYEGLSTGPEEKKMGIKGSSTRPLILDNVPVPAGNVLGDIGRGHVIAFNILNIGRYKLAAGCTGTAKWALELSAGYALQRRQFGRPIAEFPLIGKKLADMATRIFAMESMVYRTCGLIDAAMRGLDKSAPDYSRQAAKAVEEYALECSMNKVFATEGLDSVADEGVQIHGGYGYIQEYPIERIYRDSRINRIFEGTNEINRLLIPGTLLRRALKGSIPLFEVAAGLQQELMSYVPALTAAAPEPEQEPLHEEALQVYWSKKAFLLVGGTAVEAYGEAIESEQEVLEALADMMITIFAMESALLRTRKAAASGPADAARLKLMRQLTQTLVHEGQSRIEAAARLALAAMDEGDTLQLKLSMLRKILRARPHNMVALKRQLARSVLAAGRYPL